MVNLVYVVLHRADEAEQDTGRVWRRLLAYEARGLVVCLFTFTRYDSQELKWAGPK